MSEKDEGRRHDELHHQPGGGVEGPDVVDSTEREERRRPAGEDRRSGDTVEEQEPEQRRPGDGDPAEERHGLAVPAVCGRVGDAAVARGEPAAEGHQRQRQDRAGRERRQEVRHGGLTRVR